MQVRTLGIAAKRRMSFPQEGRVVGAHTGGIFLQTADGWVLYLTADPQRGPLTLNLDAPPAALGAAVGDLVTVEADELWFFQRQTKIDARPAAVWQPKPPGGLLLAPAELRARLDVVDRYIIRPQEWIEPNWPAAAGQAALTTAVCERLGRGSGLTPAWDDFALGLLLAFNRWPACVPPAFALDALNTALVQTARARTTTLSANLITCAAQGLADERLIAGLDGLANDTLDPASAAACFNTWGSSSGSFAFQGMRLALTLGLSDHRLASSLPHV